MKKLRNKFEKKIFSQLKRRKIKFEYEGKKIPYVLACHYIPDFILITPTGLVYIETKGHLRQQDKRKLVAVKKQHPEIDLRIIFYSKRPTQIKWAEKNGFKYAFELIPKEWFDGF